LIEILKLKHRSDTKQKNRVLYPEKAGEVKPQGFYRVVASGFVEGAIEGLSILGKDDKKGKKDRRIEVVKEAVDLERLLRYDELDGYDWK